MKKFLIAWVFIFTISATAFAANSSDVYLRQDLFEAKMDTFMAEIRLMNEQVRSEIKQEIQATNSRIDATNARIDVTNARLDDLYTMVYWGLALNGYHSRFFRRRSLSRQALQQYFSASIHSRRC